MQESIDSAEDRSFARLVSWRQRIGRSFGGMWRYNEIIGYIRLHFLGTQIRGEYYAVRAKRIVRTRRKEFEYKTWNLAGEISIPPDASNEEIFDAVRRYVGRCRGVLTRRVVDDESLEALGPHIDWQALFTKGHHRPPRSRDVP